MAAPPGHQRVERGHVARRRAARGRVVAAHLCGAEDGVQGEGAQAGCEVGRGGRVAANHLGVRAPPLHVRLVVHEEVRAVAGARLHDGRAEEAAGAGGAQVPANGERARALTKDRHLARVAAERADAVPHPFHRQALVLQGVVARGGEGPRLRLELVKREEAQRTQTVVGRDHNHILRLGEVLAVVKAELPVVADHPPTAIDPEHDGERAGDRGLVGHVDREVEAVLAAEVEEARLELRADVAVGVARERVVPTVDALGHAQAQVAHGRLRKGHAAPDLRVAREDSSVCELMGERWTEATKQHPVIQETCHEKDLL